MHPGQVLISAMQDVSPEFESGRRGLDQVPEAM
jgi:hypothetical protein